jgi:hypothetical protein
VVRTAAIAATLVAIASAAHADVAIERATPSRPSTWIEADLQAGIVVPSDTRWSFFGLGLELRQRVIGGLRIAARGAVFHVAPGFDPDRVGIDDDRHGTGLHAAVSIDYLLTIKRWGSLALTIAPEVGVGITQLRGLGRDDGGFTTLFAGPRLGVEMTQQHSLDQRSTALLTAHSWGGYSAIQVIHAGGDELGWQMVVGYGWAR